MAQFVELLFETQSKSLALSSASGGGLKNPDPVPHRKKVFVPQSRTAALPRLEGGPSTVATLTWLGEMLLAGSTL